MAGIVARSFSEKLSFAGIVGNQWSNSGKLNTLILQPQFYYTLAPGKSLDYVGTISADWEASSSN